MLVMQEPMKTSINLLASYLGQQTASSGSFGDTEPALLRPARSISIHGRLLGIASAAQLGSPASFPCLGATLQVRHPDKRRKSSSAARTMWTFRLLGLMDSSLSLMYSRLRDASSEASRQLECLLRQSGCPPCRFPDATREDRFFLPFLSRRVFRLTCPESRSRDCMYQVTQVIPGCIFACETHQERIRHTSSAITPVAARECDQTGTGLEER